MKILFFDYWTKGIENFTQFNKRLCEKGHDTMLFHIGSFNDSKTPKEEFIEGILCRDISYYRTKYIYKVIKSIRPDVIVSLNTTYIMDRAMVLACRNLGVKSVFLMHGDRASTADEIIKEINAVKWSFVDKIKKSGKYFSYVIPNYLYTSVKYNYWKIIRLIPIKVLWETFKRPGNARFLPVLSNELIHNKCLVYSKKYIEYYNRLGYPIKNIVITGNPKNDKFFNLINDKFPVDLIINKSVKNLISSKRRYALFIEEALHVFSYAGFTIENVIEEIEKISIRLEKENLLLVVKLHPSSDISQFVFKNKNIIISETDLEHLIFYSQFCLGHISTTINLAILLNKPVLVTKWGINKKIPDLFVNKKVGNNWENINDQLPLSINSEAQYNYIDDNITITKPVSCELVVNEILSKG